jgi:fucose 4-O-acetylase-like acetyltransferase
MSAEAARRPWIDAARGLGIVLVVLGHAIVGLVDAGLLAREGFWWSLYFLLYAFHMPLFFLLSGLFASRLAGRPGAGALAELARRLAWPYVLWSSVQLLVLGWAAPLTNHPAELSWARWLALAWQPISQFWFLQSLLVLQLLAWWLLPRAGAWGLLLLGLAAQQLPALGPLPIALTNACRFGVFFALGALLMAWRGDWPVLPGRQRLLLLATLGLGAAWGVTNAVLAEGWIPWHAGAQPAAFLGVAAMLALVLALPAGWRDALAVLGRSTMVIYLLHILFVAGTRIALSRLLGWRQPELLLAASVAAGLALPWLLGRLAQRLGWQRVLGWGG